MVHGPHHLHVGVGQAGDGDSQQRRDRQLQALGPVAVQQPRQLLVARNLRQLGPAA
jgi:hypothetical protein